ncbi:hypothetical protein G9A89_006751 [Geosiphon pyriformis]|nr:hypothetical protein G9A89_006751 [Geosiphon pyriformis]
MNGSKYEKRDDKMKLLTQTSILRYLADVAFYAHQTYCLQKDGGFIDLGIYVWVSTTSEPLSFKDGPAKAIIVQLRGIDLTYDLMEGISKDLSMIKYSFKKNIMVAKAFYIEPYRENAKNKILFMLSTYLKNNIYKQHKFVFTGHGSGGESVKNAEHSHPKFNDGISPALAVYAALDFRNFLIENKSKRDVEVVTFGEPRIGTKSFSIFADSMLSIARVTFADDFVPLFFAEKLTHHNTELWIPGDDHECNCPDSLDEPRKFPLIYNCVVVRGDENSMCNKQFHQEDTASVKKPLESRVHNGPYFGYIMGQCSKKRTNWIEI